MAFARLGKLWRRRKQRALLLHLGLRSAGIPEVHATISKHRQKLAEYGCFVPDDSLGAELHRQLAAALRPGLSLTEASHALDDVLAQLATAAGDCDRILVSSDALCLPEGVPDGHWVGLLSKHGLSLEIVIYLPRQDLALPESFEQRVRLYGQRRPFEDQVGTFTNPPLYGRWLGQLRGGLNLPRETIRVRPLEPGQLSGGQAATDLLHIAGMPSAEIPACADEQSVARLAADALEYKRLLNGLLHPDAGALASRFLGHLAEGDGPAGSAAPSVEALLSPDQASEVYDLVQEDNAHVARAYLDRPDGRMFFAPPPDLHQEWAPPTELTNEGILRITRRIHDREPALIEEAARLVRLQERPDVFFYESAERLLPSFDFCLAGDDSLVSAARVRPVRPAASTPQVILHIGTPKTGTTAIQFMCERHTDALAARGVLYPSAGRLGAGHHLLAFSLWKQSLPGMPPVDDRPQELLTAMFEEAEHRNCSKIVISSEAFSWLPRARSLGVLLTLLDAAPLQVICYLRRIDLSVESSIRQTIKALHLRVDLSRYNEGKTVSAIEDTVRCNSDLAAWLDAVPQGSMIVRPYERGQLRCGDVVSDFLGLLEIDSLPDLENEREVNPTLSNDALEYKRLLNDLFAYAPEQVDAFVEPLESFCRQVANDRADEAEPRNSPMISLDRRLAMLRDNENLSERIAREHLGRADGRLFYEPPPDPHESWRPYPGLSPEKALEITRFLSSTAGHLTALARGKLSGQRRSGGPSVDAERILGPALDAVD